MALVTHGKDLSEGTLTKEQQQVLVAIMDKWMATLVELTQGGQRTLAVNIAAFYMLRNKVQIEEMTSDIERALDSQK